MPKGEKRERICLSTLKSRGWTDTLIQKYLPAPMLEKNPHYRSSSNMKLWYLDEVERIEVETPEFQKRKEQLAKKAELKAQKKAEAKRQKEQRIAHMTETMNVHNPALDYPNARKLARHFIINVGPTNTGKTYTALQAFKQAETGVYLAPLRLLAMEIQDRMLDEGVLCSMITGEEENIIDGATHMSSTVEKISLATTYDVGIIDECQMISDNVRGGSWTRAILGLAADVIYLCMSPDALDICIKLIELCGDTYEVHEHKRNTELVFTGHINESNIKKHDAVILFSRREVLQFAEELKDRYGLLPSVVYGALPYKSRKHQVDLYNAGETDIIVSTDAIGMGMNLPIERVVFARDEKFDGVCVRGLIAPEIKQIAGRAGRIGMYDTGYVATLGKERPIRRGLETPNRKIERAYVPFPEEALKYNDAKLSEVLKDWQNVVYPDIFYQQNLDEILERVEYLEKQYKDMSRELTLRLANVMFDTKNEDLYHLWMLFVEAFVKGGRINMPSINTAYDLQSFELAYKKLDLFYSFCKAVKIDFNYDELMRRKEIAIENIDALLLEANKKSGKKKKKKQKNKAKYYNDYYYNYYNDDDFYY